MRGRKCCVKKDRLPDMDHPTPANDRPWRLAVLISGSGRTLRNLLEEIERGDLHAEVVCVVSSRDGVKGLEIAAAAGIPATVISRRAYPAAEASSAATYEVIAPYAPDLVIMAGFLRRLLVFPGWEGRILNIHPALLPDAAAYAAGKGCYGDKVHEAVLAHGDAVSGATVHVVTDIYDDGPPLMRAEVPVEPGDTVDSLAARIFTQECVLYPEAIRRYMAAHPGLKRQG
jgi:formyltetrahydrofolate-dependent phosphoribosylglycinamide formyltransferase